MRTTTCEGGPARVAAAMLVAALLGAPAVRAQGQNEAGARVLFDEGLKLRAHADWPQACAKFEAATKLFSGSGLLVNLADCYEHLGRTASAWATFSDAKSLAERVNHPDDAAEAGRRLDALGPRLTRMAVRVEAPVPGLTVVRDGAVLDPGAWSTLVPVDPGTHVVTARAPGRAPWSSTFEVMRPGETLVVPVPALQPAAPAESPPPVVAPTRLEGAEEPVATGASYWTARRIAGVTLAGAGVAAVVAGGVVALGAKSLYDTAAGETGQRQHDDSVRATSQGNVGTWVMVAGAGVGVAGLVVWLTAPGAQATTGLATDGREIFFERRF